MAAVKHGNGQDVQKGELEAQNPQEIGQFAEANLADSYEACAMRINPPTFLVESR